MSRINQRASAKAQIKRWSKLFRDDETSLALLIEGELKATRSPVRKEVYREWLDLHLPDGYEETPAEQPNHPTSEGVNEGPSTAEMVLGVFKDLGIELQPADEKGGSFWMVQPRIPLQIDTQPAEPEIDEEPDYLDEDIEITGRWAW